MQTYLLVWAPEGRVIATVQAATRKGAKRYAPKPYRKYKGEIYVQTPQEREIAIEGLRARE